ncbi:Recep_L_domain domain-containing protein [Caenorhabditis elegans]|uniref:Recep_L_domain domain-containing protein n=1 Tax=Caenorhabditis elegans TaxID=6239 RepID=Q22259_CAEEL|nr:Recep_L_domain domain-containing protein [Caenorhabditis elegans]CAA94791.2 Recep_L_domain domain-containing protein [Caenorhabditis elegans]|eukprot:NP_505485.2 Uncharacterized protein CELE_T06E4.5 [Caenorhabditis elegans]
MVIYMKRKLFVFFITLVAFLVCNAGQNGECIGGTVEDIPNDCVIIISKPLIIAEKSHENILRSKLAKVEKIKAGLEISNIRFSMFNYLQNTVSIENPTGPAIFFNGNQKLQRVLLQKLESLKGKPNELLFSKDNFIHSVFKDGNSMTDFMKLRAAAYNSSRQKCDNNFFEVLDSQAPNVVVLERMEISMAIGAITTIVIAIWICYYFCVSKEKKLKKKYCLIKKPKTKATTSSNNEIKKNVLKMDVTKDKDLESSKLPTESKRSSLQSPQSELSKVEKAQASINCSISKK